MATFFLVMFLRKCTKKGCAKSLKVSSKRFCAFRFRAPGFPVAEQTTGGRGCSICRARYGISLRRFHEGRLLSGAPKSSCSPFAVRRCVVLADDYAASAFFLRFRSFYLVSCHYKKRVTTVVFCENESCLLVVKMAGGDVLQVYL